MQTVRKRATWESATCSGDERPLARVRLWTFGCAAVCLVLGSAATPVAAGVLFGTLSNFDVLNDTGEEARGFEIELDGVTSQDIGGTFDANRYGPPKIVPFSGGVYVRYMSTWDPASQQFSAGTPVATNFTPTTGHQCISAYPAYQTSGCDHFGVWLSTTQATNVSYRWMVRRSANAGRVDCGWDAGVDPGTDVDRDTASCRRAGRGGRDSSATPTAAGEAVRRSAMGEDSQDRSGPQRRSGRIGHG